MIRQVYRGLLERRPYEEEVHRACGLPAMPPITSARLSTARAEHAGEPESVTRFPRAGAQTVKAYRTSLVQEFPSCGEAYPGVVRYDDVF
jgi:hypothetical protein